MRSNVCFLDLSGNGLSDSGLHTALKLLELCSHKLCTLILDGNHLGYPFLVQLTATFKSLGMSNLRKLSLRDCDLVCTCADKRNCPLEPLTELVAYSESLEILDMGCNRELTVAGAISHLERVRPVKRVNLSGAKVTKGDIEAVERYSGGLEFFEEVG